MKGALILLLMACLLAAMPSVAAAYEPTNGDALVATYYATKIIEKEEVVSDSANENVAFQAELVRPLWLGNACSYIVFDVPLRYFSGKKEKEVSGAIPRFT